MSNAQSNQTQWFTFDNNLSDQMIVIVRLFKKIYTYIIALQYFLITKNYLCSSTTWFKADAKMCQKNNIVMGQFKISFYLNDFAKKR